LWLKRESTFLAGTKPKFKTPIPTKQNKTPTRPYLKIN
jgi:hypothetical protein